MTLGNYGMTGVRLSREAIVSFSDINKKKKPCIRLSLEGDPREFGGSHAVRGSQGHPGTSGLRHAGLVGRLF